MKKPAHITEIFLHPGEYFFGDARTRVRTLLGSCVSITIGIRACGSAACVTTCWPSAGRRRNPAQAGAKAWMMKPFRVEQLLEVIAKFVLP